MADVVISSGKRFETNREESILDAALRQGVVLEYGCRTGRCGTCRARLHTGSTVPLHDEIGLDPGDEAAGWILTCARSADSDITLEVEDLSGVELFSARTLPCRIQSLAHLSGDVVRAVLRLPPDSRFSYRAGQYIDVIGRDGLSRSYSIANASAASGLLELYIRKVGGGAMSEYWFEQAGVNDLLRLRGPMGTCFLRDAAGRDLIFLATGTGVAPIKAMLEGLATADPADKPHSISFYWGGRVPQDIYWHPDSVDLDCRFVPVLSRAGAEWSGVRGHVQDALLESRPDLSSALVYACGSDAMIHSARRQLLDAGLSARGFRSDAFVSSGGSSALAGART